MFTNKKSWIRVICLALLVLSFSSAKAACDALSDFPLSSANTQASNIEINPDVITIRANNKIVINNKVARNAYFNQEVEAAVFPQRLVKVRKFKIEGDQAITVNLTVKTLTSQYRDAEDTLATRTFAISKLDEDGNVDCDDFFDYFTAVAGTNTYTGGTTEVEPGVVFEGDLSSPFQAFISEKGSNVTIVMKQLTLLPGVTYQFEFISQGERSALESSVIDEEYQLMFGSSNKVDIDNPGSKYSSETDDTSAGVWMGEDTQLVTSFFATGTTDIGITTDNGAAARSFEEIDVEPGKYKFKMLQQKAGKSYIATLIDADGNLDLIRSRKPYMMLKNKGAAKPVAKGVVTVNDDQSQVKDSVTFFSSRTLDKVFNTEEAGAKAIIRVNIKSKGKKNPDPIADGYTVMTIINTEANQFLGDNLVIEVSDTNGTILPRNLFVDGIIYDPDDTPDGSYSFSIDPNTMQAAIYRNGVAVTDITVTENPIDISVITDSIFVVNGDVPDEERGQLTIQVNDDGKALLDQLEIGDEVYINFDITSLSLKFEGDSATVILRKTEE